MQELLDAITRLHNALDEAERREFAKEVVIAMLAIIQQITGFPLLPGEDEWNPDQEEHYLSQIDNVLTNAQLQDWSAECDAWAELQDPPL